MKNVDFAQALRNSCMSTKPYPKEDSWGHFCTPFDIGTGAGIIV